MDKNERHLQELNMLKQNSSVEVQELSRLFSVSEMTIRRDLMDLSKEYNISRTYGGAVLNSPDLQLVRTSATASGANIDNWDLKSKIAQKAASLIQNGQRIFVDHGSTTRSLIDFLPEKDQNIIIVTNQLEIAQKSIKKESCSVIFIGGVIMKEAECSFGPTAEEQLASYHLDMAFLGASAIGNDGFIYDAYTSENAVKRKVLDMAKEIYIMADSTKFGNYNLLSVTHLRNITGVITDAGIPQHFVELLNHHNVKLMIA